MSQSKMFQIFFFLSKERLFYKEFSLIQNRISDLKKLFGAYLRSQKLHYFEQAMFSLNSINKFHFTNWLVRLMRSFLLKRRPALISSSAFKAREVSFSFKTMSELVFCRSVLMAFRTFTSFSSSISFLSCVLIGLIIVKLKVKFLN